MIFQPTGGKCTFNVFNLLHTIPIYWYFVCGGDGGYNPNYVKLVFEYPKKCAKMATQVYVLRMYYLPLNFITDGVEVN